MPPFIYVCVCAHVCVSFRLSGAVGEHRSDSARQAEHIINGDRRRERERESTEALKEVQRQGSGYRAQREFGYICTDYCISLNVHKILFVKYKNVTHNEKNIYVCQIHVSHDLYCKNVTVLFIFFLEILHIKCRTTEFYCFFNTVNKHTQEVTQEKNNKNL